MSARCLRAEAWLGESTTEPGRHMARVVPCRCWMVWMYAGVAAKGGQMPVYLSLIRRARLVGRVSC